MLATAKSCKCRRPFASFHMTQAKKQYSMFDHVLAGVVTKAQRLCSHHLTLGRAQVDQGHPTSNGVIMCMLFLTVNRPSLTVTKVQSGDLVHVNCAMAHEHTSNAIFRSSSQSFSLVCGYLESPVQQRKTHLKLLIRVEGEVLANAVLVGP
jgi:hypothetical protein